MTPLTVAEFVRKNTDHNPNDAFFELESPYALEINLNQNVAWIKLGTMVACTGEIEFEREGMLEHGLGGLLKRQISGELVPFARATGTGKLYVADNGKKILPLRLHNETLVVNGNDVLAYEPSVTCDIRLMRMAGLAAGGLTNVHLSGSGYIAITTYYDPLVLTVTPDQPLFTDPNATVAWSGGLSPESHLDASLRTFLGRGGGETFQLKFQGEGFVVVQPCEELYTPNPG